MKTLVVYFSKFGNTQMIAATIADELEVAGSTRLTSIDQITASDLAEADLVIVGSPTHRMNLPEAVRLVFGTLPKHALRGKHIAAFDTSYKMSAFLSHFTAAKKLVQRLRKLGGTRIVPPETFHVAGREGPLCDGEIQKVRHWAELIRAKLRAQTIE